ncbi:hypothetical protein PENSUB_3658 [Penicillium subrubescens]|uniref:Uncharacterized protein n=1 Tax=Penicillium subrubescens TaxID=1316194 RepID=A0A1Q5UED9_9EURO|nr:hypothetical protein PENSUB_3658 [Penicillium subrubescens]
MSLIGHVFKKVLSKNISFYIATSENVATTTPDQHLLQDGSTDSSYGAWAMKSSYGRSGYFLQTLWDMIIGLVE